MTKVTFDIPKAVTHVTNTLQKKGFEAYIVGGCVRDLFMGREPNDWDVTTNATPREIEHIFKHTFYENEFGTVGVVNDDIQKQIDELQQEDVSGETQKQINYLKKLALVEVTPYRTDGIYSDNRRPDTVEFSKDLTDDLKRRDFTMNALCYEPTTHEIVDQHNGLKDLVNKTIATVGDPDVRFNEDALRMLRAVRLATQLGLNVSPETSTSIKKNSDLLKNISQERIREELFKIIESDSPMAGMEMLREYQLLEHVIPELLPAIGCKQNGSHVYDVYEHLLRTLQHAADKNWSRDIRIAALLHDISKPETRRYDNRKDDYTFYGHEVVGSRVTKKILKRLRCSNETIDTITTLVRWHMFFSDPDEITLSAVRRIIRNVGGEKKVWDLIKLRICDRIGMGRPKERPYRLRQYEAMMTEAMRSPISVKDLKINGDQIIEMFQVKPGPKIGHILHALMHETLHEPDNNNYKWLVKRVSQLIEKNEDTLKELADKGKRSISDAEDAEIQKIKRKFKVK